MSMSLRVEGIKPPDEKWKKMKKVWDTCREAGVDVPKEVREYFCALPGYNDCPDPAGVKVEIPTTPYHDDWSQGFEVDLTKLDKDIKILRFYSSY